MRVTDKVVRGLIEGSHFEPAIDISDGTLVGNNAPVIWNYGSINSPTIAMRGDPADKHTVFNYGDMRGDIYLGFLMFLLIKLLWRLKLKRMI